MSGKLEVLPSMIREVIIMFLLLGEQNTLWVSYYSGIHSVHMTDRSQGSEPAVPMM